MSRQKTKDEIIKHKKHAIHKLNNLFECYINSDNETLLKKVDLMSYWVETYSDYIRKERDFEPKNLKSYKRGDIVKVNFGFNIGSEYGGLHYAVVINNNNARNSPVVTVIPLTSCSDENSVHKDDVFIGNEIYKSLKLKHDTISKSHDDEKKEILLYQSFFKKLSIDKDITNSFDEFNNYFENLKSLETLLNDKLEKNKHIEEQLCKIGAEISHMKSGSIALINLTTTISKMRIYDPKNTKGVLNGIRLSEEYMEKINSKMKSLFIYE